jgi:hypothetical protein
MMVYVPPSGEIPEPGAMVIAETEASVTIAIQISKSTLTPAHAVPRKPRCRRDPR